MGAACATPVPTTLSKISLISRCPVFTLLIVAAFTAGPVRSTVVYSIAYGVVLSLSGLPHSFTAGPFVLYGEPATMHSGIVRCI